MANKQTPTKIHKPLESNYSPVTLIQNPGASSKNLTGPARIAKDIAADVYNCIQKWNQYHIQGSALVQKIIHTKFKDNKGFSNELEQFIDELGEIVCRLSVHSNSLNFLSKQIAALTKLHKEELPLFITLSTPTLSKLIEDIAKAYKLELTAKQYVLENIGHSKNQQEAMFHAACWVHQQYVTNKVYLKLEIILTETGHRHIC